MLVARDPAMVTAVQILVWPFAFLSNAFVPTETMPGWLQTVAEWNPVSAVTQAVRELFGNTSAEVPVPDAWSMQNPVLYTLIWVALILIAFVPLVGLAVVPLQVAAWLMKGYGGQTATPTLSSSVALA